MHALSYLTHAPCPCRLAALLFHTTCSSLSRLMPLARSHASQTSHDRPRQTSAEAGSDNDGALSSGSRLPDPRTVMVCHGRQACSSARGRLRFAGSSCCPCARLVEPRGRQSSAGADAGTDAECCCCWAAIAQRASSCHVRRASSELWCCWCAQGREQAQRHRAGGVPLMKAPLGLLHVAYPCRRSHAVHRMN